MLDDKPLPILPPLPLATPESVTEAEEVFGVALPRLLRRLYLEVGNGGFGPHTGICGVRGEGGNLVEGPDIVTSCQQHREWCRRLRGEEPDSPWLAVPDELAWLYAWGDVIWSLVDCRDPAGPMWAWDGNHGLLLRQDETLCGWLARWLQGTLTLPDGTEPGLTGQALVRKEAWIATHAVRESSRPDRHGDYAFRLW